MTDGSSFPSQLKFLHDSLLQEWHASRKADKNTREQMLSWSAHRPELTSLRCQMEQIIKSALKRAQRWLDVYSEEAPLGAVWQQSYWKHQFGCLSCLGVMPYFMECARLKAAQQQCCNLCTQRAAFFRLYSYNSHYVKWKVGFLSPFAGLISSLGCLFMQRRPQCRCSSNLALWKQPFSCCATLDKES